VKRFAAAACFVVGLSSGEAAHSDEGACHQAIDPEAALQVFGQLRAPAGADGCSLSDLRTEQTRMRLRWTRQGEPMPDATIEPVECASNPTVAGDTLALTSPPELSAACPDAFSAMTAVVRSLRPPTAITQRPYAGSRALAVASWIGVALALVGAMLIVVMSMRRCSPET
jgi:hypothetical protein